MLLSVVAQELTPLLDFWRGTCAGFMPRRGARNRRPCTEIVRGRSRLPVAATIACGNFTWFLCGARHRWTGVRHRDFFSRRCIDCLACPARPPRPSLAKRPHTVSGVGLRDHAPADPGRDGYPVLPAVHAALPRCPRACGRSHRRRAAPVDRPRVLRARAQYAPRCNTGSR